MADKFTMQERFHERVWKLEIDPNPTSPRAEFNLPALSDDLKKIGRGVPEIRSRRATGSSGNPLAERYKVDQWRRRLVHMTEQFV